MQNLEISAAKTGYMLCHHKKAWQNHDKKMDPLKLSHLPSRNIKIEIYRTIILTVLCVCVRERDLVCMIEETIQMRVFENRVLKILEAQKEDVIGGWRKLHNKKLHNLCSSPDIIKITKSKRMKWEEYVACMGVNKIACIVLVRNPEE